MKKFTLFFLMSLVISSVSIFAQTATPGGVSGGGSNQAWFDANQLTLSNNDTVISWTNMSGNGKHAVPNLNH